MITLSEEAEKRRQILLELIFKQKSSFTLEEIIEKLKRKTGGLVSIGIGRSIRDLFNDLVEVEALGFDPQDRSRYIVMRNNSKKRRKAPRVTLLEYDGDRSSSVGGFKVVLCVGGVETERNCGGYDSNGERHVILRSARAKGRRIAKELSIALVEELL